MKVQNSIRNFGQTLRQHRKAVAVIAPIAISLAILAVPLGFQTWYGANTSGWPTTIVTFFQYFVPALSLVAMGYNYFRAIQSGGSSTKQLMEFAIIVPISIFVAGLLIPLGIQVWYGLALAPAYALGKIAQYRYGHPRHITE